MRPSLDEIFGSPQAPAAPQAEPAAAMRPSLDDIFKSSPGPTRAPAVPPGEPAGLDARMAAIRPDQNPLSKIYQGAAALSFEPYTAAGKMINAIGENFPTNPLLEAQRNAGREFGQEHAQGINYAREKLGAGLAAVDKFPTNPALEAQRSGGREFGQAHPEFSANLRATRDLAMNLPGLGVAAKAIYPEKAFDLLKGVVARPTAEKMLKQGSSIGEFASNKIDAMKAARLQLDPKYTKKIAGKLETIFNDADGEVLPAIVKNAGAAGDHVNFIIDQLDHGKPSVENLFELRKGLNEFYTHPDSNVRRVAAEAKRIIDDHLFNEKPRITSGDPGALGLLHHGVRAFENYKQYEELANTMKAGTAGAQRDMLRAIIKDRAKFGRFPEKIQQMIIKKAKYTLGGAVATGMQKVGSKINLKSAPALAVLEGAVGLGAGIPAAVGTLAAGVAAKIGGAAVGAMANTAQKGAMMDILNAFKRESEKAPVRPKAAPKGVVPQPTTPPKPTPPPPPVQEAAAKPKPKSTADTGITPTPAQYAKKMASGINAVDWKTVKDVKEAANKITKIHHSREAQIRLNNIIKNHALNPDRKRDLEKLIFDELTRE